MIRFIRDGGKCGRGNEGGYKSLLAPCVFRQFKKKERKKEKKKKKKKKKERKKERQRKGPTTTSKIYILLRLEGGRGGGEGGRGVIKVMGELARQVTAK